MRDDGFGGHVAKRLEERELPDGVSVFDFGTGGLDLAYEVMRGYDALVLVDVSRQGGEPGTLYVLEPDPAEITTIEDGEVVSPHGMDPKTVLRFVKTVGGWPGKVVVVACEPAAGEEMGLELSPEVAGGGRAGHRPGASRRSPSCARRGLRAGASLMHELSISSAIVDTALRHAGGRRVTRVDVTVGALRQVVPESLAFYFEIVSRDTACAGAELELDLVGALDALPRPAATSGTRRREPVARPRRRSAPVLPAFRCPACERAGRRDRPRATSSRSSRSRSKTIEEEQCIAPR